VIRVAIAALLLGAIPALGQACGAPYPNATCNLTTYTLPSPVPSLGGLVGAGSTIIDPNFGTQVWRVTDIHTNRPGTPNSAILVDTTGSGEELLISGDDSLAMIGDTGGAQYPITFGGATGTFPANPRLYTTTLASTNGFQFPQYANPIGWSHIFPANAKLAYVVGGADSATIQTYNFNGNCAACTPPTATTIYDFESSANGLGDDFWVTYSVTGGTSSNDLDIVVGFGGGIEWTNSFSYTTGYHNGVIAGNIVYPTTGNAGNYLFMATNAPCTGQATGTPAWNQTVSGTNADGGCTMTNIGHGFQGDQGTQYIGVWRSGSGVRVLNTVTGGVSGDWGPTGQIPSYPCSQYIHETKMGKVGGSQGWLAWSPAAPCQADAEYVWTYAAGTLTGSLVSLCNSGYCGGHTAKGMLGWVNNPGDLVPNYMDVCYVGAGTLPCPTNVANGITYALPAGGQQGIDLHIGWNSLNDTKVFCGTTWLNGVPTKAWTNEIMCWLPVYAASVNPFRFAQTENSGQSPIFQVQIATASVSMDGKWLAFTSDWQGTLGSTAGAGTCTLTTNCRGDVFAVRLAPATAKSLLGPCPRCFSRNGSVRIGGDAKGGDAKKENSL
jgi:hypothetical protein